MRCPSRKKKSSSLRESPGGDRAWWRHWTNRWVWVNDPAFSTWVAAGRKKTSVPISFRACTPDGDPITAPGWVTGVVLVGVSALPKNPVVNEQKHAATGPFAYSARTRTWVGSIPTLDAKDKRYTYRIDLADGTSFFVTFGVS